VGQATVLCPLVATSACFPAFSLVTGVTLELLVASGSKCLPSLLFVLWPVTLGVEERQIFISDRCSTCGFAGSTFT
jgi:hypothetical protein